MDNNLEAFTRKFIKNGRDKSLNGWDRIIDGKLKILRFQDYQPQIDELTDSEREMLKVLGRHLVDGCLHNLMFMFEEESHESKSRFSITINTTDGESDDIRTLLNDPLQGFYFDWIERYSKK